MVKEIGIAGTGKHKEQHLSPFFQQLGLTTKWLKIGRDIPEDEHVNPSKVLGPKLFNNANELAETIRFWAEFDMAPNALAVFDVLGLRMPATDPGKAAFGMSRDILKKPEDGNAVSAINDHFAAHLQEGSKDGWYWDAYAVGGAIAPITRQGIIRLDKGVSMWDDPFWFGYSRALVEALASKEMLTFLLEQKVLSERVVTPKSIVGLRAQYLPHDIQDLAKHVPGSKVRMIYRKQDETIESTTSLASLVPYLLLIEAAMANATPNLAMQMAKEVNSWV